MGQADIAWSIFLQARLFLKVDQRDKESCLNSLAWLLCWEIVSLCTYCILVFHSIFIYPFFPSVHWWVPAEASGQWFVQELFCAVASFGKKQTNTICLVSFLSNLCLLSLLNELTVQNSHTATTAAESRTPQVISCWWNNRRLMQPNLLKKSDVRNIEINTHIFTGCVIIVLWRWSQRETKKRHPAEVVYFSKGKERGF